MTPLNYNHLYYFYAVAKHGSITAASAQLHLTPQTISGQLSHFESQMGVRLFDRKGKRLQLSQMGQLIYQRAEAIFQLGDELRNVLTDQAPVQWPTFTVGITDVVPKALAYQLLNPAFNLTEPVRLICHEGDQDSLLADLAIDKLDLILTDRPLQPGSHVKAYNHQLVESGFTFFAASLLAAKCRAGFPQSLSGQPFLMQGKESVARQRLDSWLEKQKIKPNIIAEFDDSALMKCFGQENHGVFTAPTILEETIVSLYQVEIIGRTEQIKEHYYAISPERRLKHPAILEIVNAVQQRSIEKANQSG